MADRNLVEASGSLRAMGQGQKTRRTASRSGGSGAAGLLAGLGGLGLGRIFGGVWRFWSGVAVCRGAGIRLLFDAQQILVRDFPAEVLVLAALLEILLKENGTPGIRDEGAGGRQ